MLFFGVKWILKTLKAKEIIEFPLMEGERDVEIKRTGLFALYILGVRSVDYSPHFKIKIENRENGKTVTSKENAVQMRFHKKQKMGIEYLNFSISMIGVYKIKIEKPENLIVKQTMLRTIIPFQSSSPIENIQLLIKETVPISQKILGIIFLIVGLNLSTWGIMLGINPGLFGIQ